MQCPSVISYPADVPCPGPLPSSDLFNHVCDLCLFSYPDVCFSVPVVVTSCSILQSAKECCRMLLQLPSADRGNTPLRVPISNPGEETNVLTPALK